MCVDVSRARMIFTLGYGYGVTVGRPYLLYCLSIYALICLRDLPAAFIRITSRVMSTQIIQLRLILSKMRFPGVEESAK